MLIVPVSFASNETNDLISNTDAYAIDEAIDIVSNANAESMDETDYHISSPDASAIDEYQIEESSQNVLNAYSHHYYFNSSSEIDGDGSINNPYNKLTPQRITENSKIHLADGEYLLDNGKTLKNVSIIGESAERTFLRYNGGDDSGVFKINTDYYINLTGITVVGFNFIVKGGTLEATNTLFKDTVGSLIDVDTSAVVNSGAESFGGAIYANYDEDEDYYYFPEIKLYNCTFKNNTAKYGGAIYIGKGYIEIANSTFADNYANSYGGAIAALYDTEMEINHTQFYNDKSLKNAGGAIYLLHSHLLSYNMTIANCSSTFGGAIASLNSTSSIDYLYAMNNSAKYGGGAIYQMYNDANIMHSEFFNNSANNGGAIYLDDVKATLSYDSFEENNAILIAGAIYSLLSDFTETDNTYLNNHANESDDLYQCDKFVFNLNNGDYTLIYSNYTYNESLPPYYNLADEGYVTSIKDQKNGGNCWAFATIAALESSILKASGLNLDLSEDNMKNLAALFSDYGWNKETNDGGYDDMGLGYLTSWLGPIFESLDEYDDFGMLSAAFPSYTHIQNYVYLSRKNYTDNDAIKRAILNYGAVYTGICFEDEYFFGNSNSFYCNNEDAEINHAIAIVGWNDTYSRYNFINSPSKDGAWICKNSWADDWGDNGYFYVSYYDTSVARIGYPEDCFAFVFNDSERYDKNYQYDLIGKTDYYSFGSNVIWVKNIFESTDDELLEAVSSYFRKATDFELSIYLNGEFVFAKNGTCNPGYTTIRLDDYIPLSPGDIFELVFKLTCNRDAEFAICENIMANKLTFKQGVSFYSTDGLKWKDLYTTKLWADFPGPQVAAIKAFTKLYDYQTDIQYGISLDHNIMNILGNVSDLGGNIDYFGYVTVNIDGIDYFANIQNGKINFTHVFENLGEHKINISYKTFNQNTTVNVDKLDIDLYTSANLLNNDVIIDFESSFNITIPLKVIINGISRDLNLINGKNTLTLSDNADYYDIQVFANDEHYVCEYQSKYYKTRIFANELISNYNLDASYSIELKDCFNNPLANRQISFGIGDKTVDAITDANGIASINVQLPNRNIKSVSIRFNGEENYFASLANANVLIRSTVMFLSSRYAVNSNYNVILYDGANNPLAFIPFNVFIDGTGFWSATDSQGMISIPLGFSAGNHQVVVYNHITGEEAYQTITLVPRIIENKDMKVYYLSNSFYKVRINGDNGLPVGAGEIVKITLNKKVYYVKTDSNGYASIKISLKPKTYTITAVYKNAKVSNKILVKPLLTAKNISKKKAKKIKFQAKLVNTKGKAVKGKKITFKIKRKTYKAKTNAKGIATIYIKNLKVGKYTITTKYGKSTIKNTIKIKKK